MKANRLLFTVGLVLGLAASPGYAQTVLYYHLDALGSVRAVSNQAGQVVETHDYLPYGEESCGSGGCGPAAQPKRFTGKDRDVETGLDYFGARYYGPSIGRFTAVDPFLGQAAAVIDPQRWNRYAFASNNPLRRRDPDGRNWFENNGEWTWSPDTSGGYTHIVIFQKSGRNDEGAVTGTLTLYEQDKVVATSPAFSGGHNFGEIPNGTYFVRTDIRGKAETTEQLTADRTRLKPFYGIQEIEPYIVDENGKPVGNARWEWGSVRAALNEPRGERRSEYLGNYIHGKERPGDYTHGCISERSENVLGQLKALDRKRTPSVPVSVRE